MQEIVIRLQDPPPEVKPPEPKPPSRGSDWSLAVPVVLIASVISYYVGWYQGNQAERVVPVSSGPAPGPDVVEPAPSVPGTPGSPSRPASPSRPTQAPGGPLGPAPVTPSAGPAEPTRPATGIGEAYRYEQPTQTHSERKEASDDEEADRPD